ncbi:uncharacterized protein LOC135131502 [Zophobas morio]|uniref:uncharacterized protein LOC135131502 n=1 Tax=Zophobas morio TaxID=2755281 RepID=UPI0030831CAD
MDNADAEYYTDAINKVISNNAHIKDLLEKQTQIVQESLTTFNKTFTNFERYKQKLNENIAVFNNFTNFIENFTDGIKVSQLVTEHMTLLLQLTHSLDKDFDNLISVVLFAQRNQVHPFIITPEQFLRELKSTLSYVPSSKKYPLPLISGNAHDLLKLTELKLFYSHSELIYIISVPLVMDITFTIYHLIPLPVPHDKDHDSNTTYVFIQPQNKYIAMSNNRLQYLVMSDLEFCKIITGNVRICKQNNILYQTHNHPMCETQLMLNTRTIPKSCIIHLIRGNINTWYKLQHLNKWLFVLSEEQTLNIICNDDIRNLNIKLLGIGIFSLDNNSCKAYSKSVTLVPSKAFISECESFSPSLSLLNDTCCTSQRIKNAIDRYPIKEFHTENVNLDVINSLSHRLDVVHKEIISSQISPHLIHHSWFTQIITYLICVIICCYIFVKCYQKRSFLCKYIMCMRKNNAGRDVCLNVLNQPMTAPATSPTPVAATATTTTASTPMMVVPQPSSTSASASAHVNQSDFVQLGANLRAHFN